MTAIHCHTGGSATPVIDRYGRPLTNLRVMVTGRCNFSCFFCHMEGYREQDIAQRELTLEEIELIVEAARRLDIRAFKVTGGEPTIRNDLAEIVSTMKSLGNAYVSITTNGSLLHNHLPRLAEAGIDHINVSLHALSDRAFRAITGSSLLDRVINNLKIAREYGIPIKINFVILKDINEDDILKIIDFAAEIDASVQFIELHPVGKAVKRFREHHLPRWRVLEKLENRIVEIKYRIGLHNRPVLILDNGVKVEIVGPVGNFIFCAGCTRIRVTYDFKLIPCLNWKGDPIDVRSRLVGLESFEDKVEAVISAIKEANRLRSPSTFYPIGSRLPMPRRRWTTARLGLPKKDGSLRFTGSHAKETARKVLGEWGDYSSLV
ncbi:GTP 3',8-cyclase MoaA [Pyrodictium delaneyi]